MSECLGTSSVPKAEGAETHAAVQEVIPRAGSVGVKEKEGCKDARKTMSAEQAAKALEIAITGSVGFWITVGLLACWSLVEHSESDEGRPEARP
jgi:hypothetical protein